MPTGKSKKVVHFGPELPAPKEAEGSDNSRCSEDGDSHRSYSVSGGSARSYDPAAYL